MYRVPRLRREVESAPPGLSLHDLMTWVSWASLYGTTDPAVLVRRAKEDDPRQLTEGVLSRANLSALAILSRCAPDTWLCRPSASAIVHDTDLHSIPTEPPQLLRAPGIVEVRRPETGERLWGNYASLGWYEFEGATYLLGFTYPTGYAVARWTPAWTGQDIEPQLPALDLTLGADERGEHHEFAVAAARYLLVLGLLAEAENGPLRIELDRKERKTRHVYLGDRPARPRDAASSAPAAELHRRSAEQRPVSGHLKRQRYGEGRALVKWIYVEQYEARRWFASRWVVSGATEEP